MEKNVVFYDYSVNVGHHSYWNVWYYLDEKNYPHVVTYITVPIDKIDSVTSDDGCLSVALKEKNDCFKCYGMTSESSFAKKFSLLDRKMYERQVRFRDMFEHEAQAQEEIIDISERFINKIKELLFSAYSYTLVKNYIDRLLVSVRDELSLLHRLPYISEKDGVVEYHPFCGIDLSTLHPNVDVSLSERNILSVHLDHDSKTILNLIRLDEEDFSKCFE